MSRSSLFLVIVLLLMYLISEGSHLLKFFAVATNFLSRL